MLVEVQNVVLRMLAEGQEPAKAVEALCLFIEAQLPSTTATILLVDNAARLQPFAGPNLDPSFAKAIAGQPIGPWQGSCGAAAVTGEAMTDIDLQNAERWRNYAHLVEPLGLRACFSSPVLSRAGKVIGTIALYFNECRGPTPLEQSIVEGCLPLCLIALEHRERIAEMERLAYSDSLTNLPNRTAFRRMVEAAPRAPRSILLIDVDNLKQVNDTFGHFVGDSLIAATAKHLMDIVVEGQAFRIGGDEFAVVAEGLRPEQVANLAERIRHFSTKTLTCAGIKMVPSVTIGLASEAQLGSETNLLQQADQALYHGKEFARGTWTAFDPKVVTTIGKRNQAIQLLSNALAERRVEAWYQPICRLDTRQMVGTEALARIRLDDGTILAAGNFHEATKDARVAGELTRQMIQCIAKDIGTWRASSVPFQHVGVNVSASDLSDDDFLLDLKEAFTSANIPLSHIILEITESVYLGDRNGRIARQIKRLREAGFKIALDDFGTGFASLTHLLTVPVDIIKIDKSFVDLLGANEASTAIIEGLLHIAQRTGIKVVAEGIELESQEKLLLERGCRLGQGYLYSKALPGPEAARLLKERGQNH
ncbi:GAF sensor-containing diguanylate cyclase/phosphodiesterase [Agrobacterium albertimagni AOL15]|uniref:GAF sensor-containing diguanylate cyclase/phosphodiesterase n=1 Tax=Agrobacterium albertimagni AOL15 TaxID=1156935 RepID=K2QGW0_9HYPH|nr:GGDEF and EAL domain-containing protein [Agrobacterium albertimagni]EKF60306.1 GAF sensor-containing diguanylate cyclase/phosphodiesterase [Agrobacterium albertimagni AOL15]